MGKKLQGSSVSGFIQKIDKKFLIIKRATHDTFPNLWELPGGGIEYGENPKSSIKREINEEVGLTVTVQYPLFANDFIENNKHTIDISYLCEIPDELQQVQLSSDHSDFAWVTFDSVSEYHITPLSKSNLHNIQHHILIDRT